MVVYSCFCLKIVRVPLKSLLKIVKVPKLASVFCAAPPQKFFRFNINLLIFILYFNLSQVPDLIFFFVVYF